MQKVLALYGRTVSVLRFPCGTFLYEYVLKNNYNIEVQFHRMITFKAPKQEHKSLKYKMESYKEMVKHKEERYQKSILDVVGESDHYVSVDQWKRIRTELLNRKLCHLEASANGLLMKTCIQAGFVQAIKSLYDSIKSSDKCTITILSLLLHFSGQYFDQVDENFVYEIYDELKGRTSFLDYVSAANAISALCHTKRWKESLEIIEMIKVTSFVRARSYKNVIVAAFAAGESQIAWKLFHEMQENYCGISPTEILLQWLKNCNTENSENKAMTLVELMFSFLQQYKIYPNTKVMEEIKKFFERKKEEKWIGEFTEIPVTANGKCPICRTHLEKLKLSPEEFKLLQTNLIEHLFTGDDTFWSSTPAEVKKFKTYIEMTAPFDIVIDGLNAMYRQNNKDENQPRTRPDPGRLLNVVSYFVKHRNQRVLVLGKLHMLKTTIINPLRKMAACFLTSNISEDDPFVLYAAMYSGLHCRFLSRDLMRDHAARLDNTVKKYFDRWRRTHQLTLLDVIDDKCVHIQQPDLYITALHKNSAGWHIPYNDGSPRFSYQLPIHWLCLHRKQ